MLKVEHIGIAVRELSQSVPLFEKLLNTSCYKTEAVESEQVATAFFKTGDTKIELLESSNPEGVIARFIERKGEGIHHIAFEVEDIEAEVAGMRARGIRLIGDPGPGKPITGVVFVHPRETKGVLMQLVQRRPEA